MVKAKETADPRQDKTRPGLVDKAEFEDVEVIDRDGRPYPGPLKASEHTYSWLACIC